MREKVPKSSSTDRIPFSFTLSQIVILTDNTGKSSENDNDDLSAVRMEVV